MRESIEKLLAQLHSKGMAESLERILASAEAEPCSAPEVVHRTFRRSFVRIRRISRSAHPARGDWVKMLGLSPKALRNASRVLERGLAKRRCSPSLRISSPLNLMVSM